jgi:hypothetical protein
MVGYERRIYRDPIGVEDTLNNGARNGFWLGEDIGGVSKGQFGGFMRREM